MVTGASEKNHILNISTDVGAKFFVWEPVLRQKYGTGIPIATLSDEARDDRALYRFRNKIIKNQNVVIF